ncbi:MAG: hypothetical protein B7Y39_08790 [Bdellovibrio sp. 28-41-41]|nr:MAG: hypothetical protein B7Y39_08790 [Bdellovibrio sp. 28-41-41]
MKLLITLLLTGSALLASVPAPELRLTCTTDHVPTLYGEARITFDLFNLGSDKYSSIMEVVVDGLPTLRFKQPEYIGSRSHFVMNFQPTGPAVQVNQDGTETELADSRSEINYSEPYGVWGLAASIKFQPSTASDLAIEYVATDCKLY